MECEAYNFSKLDKKMRGLIPVASRDGGDDSRGEWSSVGHEPQQKRRRQEANKTAFLNVVAEFCYELCSVFVSEMH